VVKIQIYRLEEENENILDRLAYCRDGFGL
jgi:hypothetical protein